MIQVMASMQFWKIREHGHLSIQIINHVLWSGCQFQYWIVHFQFIFDIRKVCIIFIHCRCVGMAFHCWMFHSWCLWCIEMVCIRFRNPYHHFETHTYINGMHCHARSDQIWFRFDDAMSDSVRRLGGYVRRWSPHILWYHYDYYIIHISMQTQIRHSCGKLRVALHLQYSVISMSERIIDLVMYACEWASVGRLFACGSECCGWV